jgi:hypothetical protein
MGEIATGLEGQTAVVVGASSGSGSLRPVNSLRTEPG